MRVTTLFGDLSLGRITDRRREIVLASVRGTWVQGSRRMAKYLYGKVYVRNASLVVGKVRSWLVGRRGFQQLKMDLYVSRIDNFREAGLWLL